MKIYIGKNFSSVRMTEHWHRLPGVVVECTSLEIFRRGLGTVLSNLSYSWLCFWVGWNTILHPKFSSNFSCSQILWFLSDLSFPRFLLTTSVFFLDPFSVFQQYVLANFQADFFFISCFSWFFWFIRSAFVKSLEWTATVNAIGEQNTG